MAALALATGCGGEDEEATPTSASAAQPPTSATEGGGDATTEGTGAAGSGEEDGGEAGSQQGSANPADDGQGGLAGKAKSDVEGFKASPGGDDSIQTFGEEAEDTEEEEILAAMGSFLRVMANDDYAAICAGISASNRAQLEQLMKLKKQAGDCASLLKGLLVGPNSEARNAAEGTVHQVRVEGENAFILFTPLGGRASYFVMKRDPDGWKSTSIGTGTPFDPVVAPTG
jgi:hypothetical protein